jgi:hypothetical protein
MLRPERIDGATHGLGGGGVLVDFYSTSPGRITHVGMAIPNSHDQHPYTGAAIRINPSAPVTPARPVLRMGPWVLDPGRQRNIVSDYCCSCWGARYV